ncbi:MAG: STAS domain-containing protein [Pseudomonadota bacterium]
MTTNMHVKTQSSEGKARISLSGRFDFNSHRLFRDAYEEVLASGDATEIEVDMGAVDYLDSSALGMLLLLREKSLEANKALALSNCRGVVQQILDVANFGKLFTIR